MKKSYFLFVSIVLVFLTSYVRNISMNSMQQKENYVPNAETAIKVAEAIWYLIYGEKIYDNRPFIAKLADSSVWIVEGSLKNNLVGGVPYIEIQRSDCKILKVTHGK